MRTTKEIKEEFNKALSLDIHNDLIRDGIVHNLTSIIEADMRELREAIEGMGEQNHITQAILGALEYRGFNDAGKYLDGDIWERVKPIILSAIDGTYKPNTP